MADHQKISRLSDRDCRLVCAYQDKVNLGKLIVAPFTIWANGSPRPHVIHFSTSIQIKKSATWIGLVGGHRHLTQGHW